MPQGSTVRVCSLPCLAGAALAACLGACGGEVVVLDPAEQVHEAGEAGDVFTDVAAEAGLDFTHFNGMTGDFFTAEVTAAGCGLFDYDNDGDLDVYMVQGRILAPGKTLADALYPPDDDRPLIDRLYRNDLDRDVGTPLFTDVTEESGIVSPGYGMGVIAGDYDNDGWVDLYVTNLGPNQMFRNRGDGTFEDVTTRAGTGDEEWSVPAAFFDYDRDGLLDLFVGNYVRFSFEDPKTCFRVTGARDYCGPLAYQEIPDRLFRNRGDGTFEDMTRAAGVHRAFGSALGVVTSDADGDGWADLYVANDGRPNQLWINGGDGRFVDEALLRGSAVNAEGYAEASMGVVAGDFDGDGDEDLFMAHLLGETNTFFVNDGMGGYEDASVPAGLAIPSKWATAFGAVDLDYDNDGALDLLTVNGEVRVIEAQARDDVPFPLRQPNQLFRNRGDGRFDEVTDRAGPAFAALEVSRGAATGDLDNDGDTDVVVLNNNGAAQLLLNNVGQARRWIGFRMVDRNGRAGLGARLALTKEDGTTVWRRVHRDGSFASSLDPRVLFGLGADGGLRGLVAHWPSGRVEEWSEIEIGRYNELIEGTGNEVSD